MTARERGAMLFELTGRRPRYTRVPIGLFEAMAPTLGARAHLFPRLADRAEFARIARYYASESMLALDPETGHYDDAATPAYGRDTLRACYGRVIRDGLVGQELGDHAPFWPTTDAAGTDTGTGPGP